jgi:DNA polymerase III alpha subunit
MKQSVMNFLSTGKLLAVFICPAMRGLLRRLKCNNYKILVAASSIIRPGVAQSGMMKGVFYEQPPRSVRIFS